MSSNFHLHFISKSQSFDITFNEKAKASKNTVLVDGRNYELQGDSFKIAWLKSKIPEFNNSSEISLKDLQISLQSLGAKDITTVSKTNSVGVESLSQSAKVVSSEGDVVVMPGKGAVMNQLLESLVKHRGFAGTVLVVDHGKTILKSGYGKAQTKDSEPMSSKTRFPIGSVTKPITSLAILKLVENGGFIDPITKEKIQDPAKVKILDFIPKSCQPEDEVRASWEGITLLDLMNHTAGFPSFPQRGEKIEEAKMAKKYPFLSAVDVLKLSEKKRTGTPLLPTEILELMEKYPTLSSIDKVFKLLQEEVVSTPLSPQEWVDLVRNNNLTDNLKDTLSETGGKYNYSNFGYILLGKIIENVSGDNYASFMNRFLQDELGFKETGYVETDLSDAIYAEPLVWGHKEQSSFSADKNELDPPVEAYSAGGLYSTVEDLQILSDQQITSIKKSGILGEKEGVRVEKDPRRDFDFRQQFTCVNGWNISSGDWMDSSGKPMQEIWKTGAVGGYGSLMVFYPNQNSSIVILSNQPRDVESITTDLSHMLCLEGSSKEGALSHWEGLYRIPSWGVTFSISRQDSQYVFRETHPVKQEIVLDGLSNAKEIVFPNWGNPRGTHSIKKIEDQLLLCGPDGSPILGAVVEKAI